MFPNLDPEKSTGRDTKPAVTEVPGLTAPGTKHSANTCNTDGDRTSWKGRQGLSSERRPRWEAVENRPLKAASRLGGRTEKVGGGCRSPPTGEGQISGHRTQWQRGSTKTGLLVSTFPPEAEPGLQAQGGGARRQREGLSHGGQEAQAIRWARKQKLLSGWGSLSPHDRGDGWRAWSVHRTSIRQTLSKF